MGQGLFVKSAKSSSPLDMKDEEEFEELHMLTNFSKQEIFRLKSLFYTKTNGEETLSKDEFIQRFNFMTFNPLKERICYVMGFSHDNVALDFTSFLCGLALFNAPGQRDIKLKTSFLIHDMDDDGLISKDDMTSYLKSITNHNLSDDDVLLTVDRVFEECSSHTEFKYITLSDYKKVVQNTDFQLKLHLPI